MAAKTLSEANKNLFTPATGNIEMTYGLSATSNNLHPVVKTDSLPKTINDTVVVPFEYKQSALNYKSTFHLIDSVVAILDANDSVTFSIDGYAYFEEAGDEICYWLSLNRALSVKNYVTGRGIDSSRMQFLKGMGNERSIMRRRTKEPVRYNYTAEIILNYPMPEELVPTDDMDGSGIRDEEDSCKTEFGERALNGCPDRNAIIVPFELQQSFLFSTTYKVLDSVVKLLQDDPSLTIRIKGHAYKKEGIRQVCNQLAKDRADIARRYLLTRRVDPARIESVESFGSHRPITAGRNPWEISRNARAEIILVHH